MRRSSRRANLRCTCRLPSRSATVRWISVARFRTASVPVTEVRAALRATDSALPLPESQPLGELVDRAVSPRRFILQVLGAFAASALALASLGIVWRHLVCSRPADAGVRHSHGSWRSAGNMVGGVMKHTLALTLAGIALGLVGSLALSRVIATMLYGVRPTDPVSFVAMALVLTAVALVAGVRAREASGTDRSRVGSRRST